MLRQWAARLAGRPSLFAPKDLLHRYRDVGVPGDVDLIANFDFVEHGWINDTSAVFPSVRTSEGDRGCALVDRVDSHGHRSLHDCRAARSRLLPGSGGRAPRIDWGLARWLHSRRDVVVVHKRHLVPDLELI